MFCPECGKENASISHHCENCSLDLDRLQLLLNKKEKRRAAKRIWPVLAFCIILGVSCLFAEHQSYVIPAEPIHQLVVTNDEMNIFFSGGYNPVSLLADGYAYDSLIVSSSWGKIMKNSGGYTASFDSSGAVDINVDAKLSGGRVQHVGKKSFRVRKFPSPVARIGNLIPGNVGAGIFKAQQCLLADIPDMPIDLHIPIIGFDVKCFRDDSARVLERHVDGNNLSAIKDLMQATAPKDIFLFGNINVRMPNGEVRRLEDIYYKLD